ncbi:hypothetical protein [Nostoc linckia]|nr:hypothetical protein [Nostoc linckia]
MNPPLNSVNESLILNTLRSHLDQNPPASQWCDLLTTDAHQ